MNTKAEKVESFNHSNSESLIGLSKFSLNEGARDLYWSLFIDGEKCRWIGYHDAYWWDNVSTSDQFQVREHRGKRYRLDPYTNEVFLIKPTHVSSA